MSYGSYRVRSSPIDQNRTRHSADEFVDLGAPIINIESINVGIKRDGEVPSMLREQHVVPAGTYVYRVADRIDDTGHGPTYISYLEVDRLNWKHGLSMPSWEHVFRLKEALYVPSRKEVYRSIGGIVFQSSELIRITCENWLSIFKHDPDNFMARMSLRDTVSRFYGMSFDDKAFFTMQTLGTNADVKNELIEALSRKGYNAMTDEAGLGGQSGTDLDGADPLIVFDKKRSLIEVKCQPITKDDEKQAEEEYLKIFGVLQHSGIHGMRWGIRRFQNEDGSYTEEGKRRYGLVDRIKNQIRKDDAELKQIHEERLKRWDQTKKNFETAGKVVAAAGALIAAYAGYKYLKTQKVKAYAGLMNAFMQKNGGLPLDSISGAKSFSRAVQYAKAGSNKFGVAADTNRYLRSTGQALKKGSAMRIYQARGLFNRAAKVPVG